MKIGIPKYINALPFTYPIEQKIIASSIEFVKEAPSTINKLLEEGKIDAALTSSYFYLQNEMQYEPLPFCIAAKEQVASVLFFKKENTKGTHYAVTEESTTSVELLKLIVKNKWKQEASYTSFSPETTIEHLVSKTDGFLLIGDKALQAKPPKGFIVYDLASLWYEMTKVPFVFALFIKKIGSTFSPSIQEELSQALEWSNAHMDTIIFEAQKCISCPEEALAKLQFREKFESAPKSSNFSTKTSFAKASEEKFTPYFQHLIYTFTNDEEMGLTLFSTLCKET